MTQLALPLQPEPNRWEIPASRTTWRDEHGQVQIIYRPPHCVDFSWPWWTPEPWGTQAKW